MTGFEGTFESAAERLAGAIERSVAGSVDGRRRVAVAFSGGLDSSILAETAKRRARVVACTAFSSKSLDGTRAEAAANALGVEFVGIRLKPESVECELLAMRLPFDPSLMDKSLWCLYSLVARGAKGAGADVVLLGQLSDELFGGYAKYEAALERDGPGAAQKLMAEDVSEYAKRGRIRDYDACSRWLEPSFPFEAREVMELGAALPADFKIRNGVRKAVLRRAATLLGVPEELATFPKKAAQYSSGIQKMLG